MPLKINGKQYVMDYVIVPTLEAKKIRCFRYSSTVASHKLVFPSLTLHYKPCGIVFPLTPFVWKPCKLHGGTRTIFLLHATQPWINGFERYNINT